MRFEDCTFDCSASSGYAYTELDPFVVTNCVAYSNRPQHRVAAWLIYAALAVGLAWMGSRRPAHP